MAKYFVLESKWGNGIFVDDASGKVLIKFKNGRASVNEAKREELKLHPKWGIEFGDIHTIFEAYGFRHVRVQRSESALSNADDSIRMEDNRLGSPRQRAAQLAKELANKG